MMLISVIIPLYNKDKTIGRAIESVLSQSVNNFEVIVMDDGSTDNSLIVVGSFNDSRIKVFHQENKGVGAARNVAVSKSSGDIIAFLDADDTWDNTHIEYILYLHRKYPECIAWCTGYRHIHLNGEITYPVFNRLAIREDGLIRNYFEVASLSSPPLWTSAVAIKKATFMELNGFAESVTSGEDLLLWARLATIGDIAMTLKCSANYYLGHGNEPGNRPTRGIDRNDVVARQLLALARNSADIWLYKYLAHWYRMRASVALCGNNRAELIKSAIMSLRYNPLNYNVWCYLILSLVPYKFAMRIISFRHKE